MNKNGNRHGDWELGIGDWGLGIGPNPQSPIPNPQSPIPIFPNKFLDDVYYLYLFKFNSQNFIYIKNSNEIQFFHYPNSSKFISLYKK